MRQSEVLNKIQNSQYGKTTGFLVRYYIGVKKIFKQEFGTHLLASAACREWNSRGPLYWSNIQEVE